MFQSMRVRLALIAAAMPLFLGEASEAGTGREVETVQEDRPEVGSIWDRVVPGTGETYGQRVVDPPNESQVEPALLPLPAPVLIGGVAVASALILRQRLRR